MTVHAYICAKFSRWGCAHDIGGGGGASEVKLRGAGSRAFGEDVLLVSVYISQQPVAPAPSRPPG